MLPLNVELLYYYANELCRAKGDHTPVEKNWHYKFYERYPHVKILRARSMEKARLINEDLDDYIKWFRTFIEIIIKWGFLPEDMHNMNELKAGLRFTQKSYIIGPEEEKDARVLMNANREWVTLIKTINVIGKALESFFINKGAQVFRDLMKAIVKLGATLVITHNK
jgi:hypothetical protein